MAWSLLEYYQLFPYQNRYPSPKLYELLECPYALFGAYVMRRYLPERKTFTLDVLIHACDANHVKERLSRHAHECDFYADTHQYYILESSKLFITVICSDYPWVQKALHKATSCLDLGTTEPSLPYEWLVFSKFFHGSRQDFLDCARLITRARPYQLFDLVMLVEEWIPKSIEELRALYKTGKREQQLQNTIAIYRNQNTEYTPWHHLSASMMNASNYSKDQPCDLTTPKGWPESMIYPDSSHLD